jgi:hypothetical protein
LASESDTGLALKSYRNPELFFSKCKRWKQTGGKEIQKAILHPLMGLFYGSILPQRCILFVFPPVLMVSECRQAEKERGRSRFPRKGLCGRTFSKSVGLLVRRN